jgi:tetratricopeptide (TPR) repeat protein
MSVLIEEAEQQVRLWLQLAHEAYQERQLLRALHYFHRALNYAREGNHDPEVALICRDLGYVYGREGSLDQALSFIEQGLGCPDLDVAVRSGLMANKATVLVRLGEYRVALELLQECSELIRSGLQDFTHAPRVLIRSYEAIAAMTKDLGKVVEFIDMGINPDRIQVEIRSYDPPWFSKHRA